MRLVLAALLLCGCGPDHYGTYFIADGRNAQIEFDHAEFFFGSETDGGFATPLDAPTGRVFRRQFVPSDGSVPTSGNRTASYFLPTDSATEVGNYVLVVARDAGEAIVGVADATGFPIASGNEVIQVQLPLVPPEGNVEVWGTTSSCAAWTRSGTSSVGVVENDNRDCDGAVAAEDCDDLSYCAPGDTSCSTEPSLCQSPCALGCRNSGNQCAPSVCLPAATCALPDACRTAGTVAERLACIATSSTHVHSHVRVKVDGQPCVDSFEIPLPGGMLCNNPVVEFSQPLADGYTFRVKDEKTSCTLEIKAPSSPTAFAGHHHVLISIDPSGGIGPRPTFFVGVKPVPYDQTVGCTTPVSTDNQLVINRCQ